eukprot:3654480-Ditylum_brightwellii.AAC.1
MCGYVRARMALAIVRCNRLLLRGPQDRESRLWRPAMEDRAGISCRSRGNSRLREPHPPGECPQQCTHRRHLGGA